MSHNPKITAELSAEPYYGYETPVVASRGDIEILSYDPTWRDDAQAVLSGDRGAAYLRVQDEVHRRFMLWFNGDRRAPYHGPVYG